MDNDKIMHILCKILGHKITKSIPSKQFFFASNNYNTPVPPHFAGKVIYRLTGLNSGAGVLQ